MKRCTKCGELKGFGEYHKDGKVSGGLKARCKACVAKYHRKYQEANKERRAEHQRKYREANKEKRAEYLEANKERLAEYREVNKERLAEYSRKYRETNKEKCAEYRRKWRKENGEKFLENQRKYREKIRHEKRFMETMNAISELSNKKEG